MATGLCETFQELSFWKESGYRTVDLHSIEIVTTATTKNIMWAASGALLKFKKLMKSLHTKINVIVAHLSGGILSIKFERVEYNFN